jgi:hypothetical protein
VFFQLSLGTKYFARKEHHASPKVTPARAFSAMMRASAAASTLFTVWLSVSVCDAAISKSDPVKEEIEAVGLTVSRSSIAVGRNSSHEHTARRPVVVKRTTTAHPIIETSVATNPQ